MITILDVTFLYLKLFKLLSLTVTLITQRTFLLSFYFTSPPENVSIMCVFKGLLHTLLRK